MSRVRGGLNQYGFTVGILPVFDILSLVHLVHDALVAGLPPRRAPGDP